MGTTRDIISKAMKDAEFRKRLLKDSKATLQKELGIELPAGVTVKVHENSETVINLVLPGPIEVSSQRALSDSELQQVAGGIGISPPSGPLPIPLPGTGGLTGGGLAPRPGGGIAAGNTFGAYTGCCSGGMFGKLL